MNELHDLLKENNNLRNENKALKKVLEMWRSYATCYPNCSWKQWDDCVRETTEICTKYTSKN